MNSIALCLRTLLGDGNYSMLRERKIARHGYEEFADLFRNTPAPRNLLFCVPEYCMP